MPNEKNLIELYRDRQIDLSWLTEQRAKGVEVIDGVPIADRIKKVSQRLGELVAKMGGYDPDGSTPDPDWKPSFPDYEEVLAMDVYPEYNVHYMGLPGWGYRNIVKHPNEVRQQIYDVARLTRKSGAMFMRTFLMNGSRKPHEKYMMDALPWSMVKQGGTKVIDFTTTNEQYWEVVRIIEEACKYWKIHHRPTFWMDRYNYDIFNRAYNVQNIHGFWEDASVPVKIDFMTKFFQMQRAVRGASYKPYFEFINEPIHGGNHEYGFKIADHHLYLWRGIESFTDIGRAMTCSRGSEFAHANFVEEDCTHFNRCFGFSPEFDSRDIVPEFHGVSTLETLIGDLGSGLGSGWRHLAYNEDGADDGSYNPIPWTSFRLASPSELYDTLWYGHTKCREKNKKFIFTCFMMDCLRQDAQDNMIAKEEFDPEQIAWMNWSRAGQYRQMRIDTA